VSFDSVAPFYRALETIVFGNALQRARVRWLGEIGTPRRALIVGEGNGRFLRALVRSHPDLRIDCVDESARMLALAEKRLGASCHDSNVAFIHENVLKWESTRAYDLIVTHFVLDCFEADALEIIVRKLARAASPNAVWLLADFNVPSSRWAKWWANVWLSVMYTFFQWTTGLSARRLVNPAPCLHDSGFVCHARELSRSGFLKTEVWVRNQVVPSGRD
jgi:ubiquinone/menaquinone biosynthesis C-methylase UbiE